MTSTISIFSQTSIDTSASIILTSPTGKKILINCGEGTQRLFLENASSETQQRCRHKLKQITKICFTELSSRTIGGLGGMILTSADMHSVGGEDVLSTTSLEMYGPVGTEYYINSLRHFIRREKMNVIVREAVTDTSDPNMVDIDDTNEDTATTKWSEAKIALGGKNNSPKKNKNGKKKKRKGFDIPPEPEFDIEPILCRMNDDESSNIVSYLFYTSKLIGKFQVDKAIELGIPSGPLRAKLKAGQSVTFIPEGKDEEITVHSNQVVSPSTPGLGVIVLSCPTSDILDQLKQNETLCKFQLEKTTINSKEISLDCMIHLIPKSIYNDTYKNWIQLFSVQHIICYVDEFKDESLSIVSDFDNGVAQFKSSIKGAMKRNLLHGSVFPKPFIEKESQVENEGNIVIGKAGMEYILLPKSKQAIDTSYVHTNSYKSELKENEAKAIQLAKSILQDDTNTDDACEIVLTGTGAAIPCKHRNVTGNYIRFSNTNAMVLDCGEGTVGQLLRYWMSCSEDRRNYIRERILSIKAIWISHPHADHHLGIIRLLSLRQTLLKSSDPVLIIAPISIFYYLREYSSLHRDFQRSYIQLQCLDILYNKNPYNIFSTKLQKDFGITTIKAIPVIHCPNAYAIYFQTDCFSFGKGIVYSGDCRPCYKLAEIANGADILLHEATFTTEVQDAVNKKHSTVNEAIDVAKKMNVKKALILTHFSQRYPKLPAVTPVVNDKCNVDIVEREEDDYVVITKKQKIDTAVDAEMEVTIHNDSEALIKKTHENTIDTTKLSDETMMVNGINTIETTVDANNVTTSTVNEQNEAEETNVPIIFGFDFMTLQSNTIDIASKLTPALRLLYPDYGEDKDDYE